VRSYPHLCCTEKYENDKTQYTGIIIRSWRRALRRVPIDEGCTKLNRFGRGLSIRFRWKWDRGEIKKRSVRYSRNQGTFQSAIGKWARKNMNQKKKKEGCRNAGGQRNENRQLNRRSKSSHPANRNDNRRSRSTAYLK